MVILLNGGDERIDYSRVSSEDLVVAFYNNLEREVLGELYQRHYGDLVNLAYKFVKNREAAADLVSDSFFGFFFDDKLSCFVEKYQSSGEGNINRYLGAAVRYRTIRFLKDRRRYVCEDEISDLESQVGLDKRIVYEALHAAIGDISNEKQRSVVQLRVEGWKHERIARELNIPRGTARSRLNRGKKEIRNLHPELGEMYFLMG